MKLKHLELKNFQVIKDFSGDFDGNVYFVRGENELGKSTLLKAIGILLTGNRDSVLRTGQEKGFAKTIIGDDNEEYEVKLSFTKANPRGTLTITQKSTGKRSDNVSMIQKIFGYTDYDAVEFSRWSETAEGRRKQIEVVKSLFHDEVLEQINAIDEKITGLKTVRADVNRELKTYTTICKEANDFKPGDLSKYAEKKDITALVEEQRVNAQLIEKSKTVRTARQQRIEQIAQIGPRKDEAKKQHAEKLADINDRRNAAKIEYEKAILEAKEAYDNKIIKCDYDERTANNFLKDEIEKIEADNLDYTRRKENADKWLADFEKNSAKMSDTTAQLSELEEHNRMHAKVVDYLQKKEQMENKSIEAATIEKQILELTGERASVIAKQQLPIEGLTFSEEGLELNGIPFAPGKVSDSQIMEVAVKLGIAMNQTVKVFRIARGESLGEKRLKSIIKMAKENGFQGFIEEVKRGQEDLIVEEYEEA